jgi:Domain of unknown function (DUF4258)
MVSRKRCESVSAVLDDDQPWVPARASISINEIARNKQCDFSYTKHAKDRLDERRLITSDVMYVLKNGHVYEEPEASTMKGFYKYKVECQSPNSGARFLRVVVIPDRKSCQLKMITIMWRDEE